MGDLINYLNVGKLENAKKYLVPHIFTENYFRILKARLANKQLSYNEQYYYNHFIKKKLKGMMELFGIEGKMNISNKARIRKDRLKKAISLIMKYSRKHKNMKILITGSFLYKEKYNDIDIFIISKYDKEDYREGKIHANFLPADIEKTLFFKSLSATSVSNFVFDESVDEKFKLADILHLYEVVILMIMQGDEYLAELRELVLTAEYVSGGVILDSIQLNEITAKIKRSKHPIKVLNKYIVTKIINSYKPFLIKKVLSRFIEKNSTAEKGRELYPNWKIYNQTYMEAMEVVT
jgi:hypothetical protein